MIKIIEQGQKTFTRTCDRCGCKFQYDLSDLSVVDHIICPCCNTTLVHIGPKALKIDLNKASKINWNDKTPCNFDMDNISSQNDHQSYTVKVGDADYTYGTTTGQYVNPNIVTTIGNINKSGSDCVTSKVDPNITIYANKLPDDIVDDKYNNVSMNLPDDVQDNCCYESDSYKALYEKWCKEIREREPIKCKK